MNPPSVLLDDTVSSFQNSTTRSWRLFEHPGSCGGDSHTIAPLSSDRDITPDGFDNKASCLILIK